MEWIWQQTWFVSCTRLESLVVADENLIKISNWKYKLFRFVLNSESNLQLRFFKISNVTGWRISLKSIFRCEKSWEKQFENIETFLNIWAIISRNLFCKEYYLAWKKFLKIIPHKMLQMKKCYLCTFYEFSFAIKQQVTQKNISKKRKIVYAIWHSYSTQVKSEQAMIISREIINFMIYLKDVLKMIANWKHWKNPPTAEKWANERVYDLCCSSSSLCEQDIKTSSRKMMMMCS